MYLYKCAVDDKSNIALLKKHLRRDFVITDRTPFKEIANLMSKGQAEAFFAVEGGEYRAYTVLHYFKGAVQILYLAVMPEHRGQGVGGQVISLIKEIAGDRPIVLEVEDADAAVDMNTKSIRVRRVAFYKRHGFNTVDGVKFIGLICRGLKVMACGDITQLGQPKEFWRDMYCELIGNRKLLKRCIRFE